MSCPCQHPVCLNHPLWKLSSSEDVTVRRGMSSGTSPGNSSTRCARLRRISSGMNHLQVAASKVSAHLHANPGAHCHFDMASAAVLAAASVSTQKAARPVAKRWRQASRPKEGAVWGSSFAIRFCPSLDQA